ncbi:hypothetical protein ACI2JW_18180 [Serratia ureilytica]|uniref:hypothetical protein n=1 Tax=Serratia ureilytica TaxID=300181 RepID=UPI00384D799B
MDKLSELSKPVAWEVKGILCHSEEEARIYVGEPEPLYSQEYVSALIQRAERIDSMLTESVQALKETEQKSAELEQAMRHIHGALLDITVPRVAIAKAAELAVEHASMKEQNNG